jgi:general secretion pathway protein C
MQLNLVRYSFNQSELAQTIVVPLTTFLALALLGWVLAYWTWAWLSPQAEFSLPPALAPAGRVESASGLFGRVQRDTVSTGSTIGLIGVIAASGGGSGYAIMRFAQQPVRPTREGEEIAPGVRLSEVHPDHVIIERSGVFETIALPLKKTATEPVAPTSK